MMNTAELILSVQAQNMKRSMEALDKLRIEAVQARRSSCLSAVFSQSQGGQTFTKSKPRLYALSLLLRLSNPKLSKTTRAV